MAGLLSNDYTPDPLGQGLLGLGAALMTPRQLGGGVGPGLLAFNQQAQAAQMMRRQMEQDAMQRKLFDLKLSEANESAEDRKRKREQEAALVRAAQAAYRPASPGSLGGGVAPGSEQGRMLLSQASGDPEFDAAMLAGTNSALNSVGPQQPVSAPTAGGFDRRQFADNLYGAGLVNEGMRVEDSLKQDSPFNKIDPKDFTRDSVAKFSMTRDYADLVPLRKREFVDGVAVDPYETQPGAVVTNPLKAAQDLIVPDGKGGFMVNPLAVQAKKDIARAGAPQNSVVINEGQKGFENEFKLREGFKAEPVYKAYQEMQSAYSQIVKSLSEATPVGDMAGATKIMKLLDPGSVVRESELGMAMAATGLLDRARNYAKMVTDGTKLTPQQRVEFRQLADALYGESVKQFNAKRGEYIRLGSEYGLNAERAIGAAARPGEAPPSAPGAPAGGWSIQRER
jgi:hypothetical protein